MSSDNDPPPAYSDVLGQIFGDQQGLGTKASIAEDGRVNIRIDQKTKGLSSLLVPALRSQLDLTATQASTPPSVPPGLGSSTDRLKPPSLNVVIHVVGSRGDVQPFVALGKVLKEQWGHRVRLATHPVFRDFVEENGLEFFSIGGDPSELMAFMVKNPGLMPGFDTMRKGDIGRRRHEIGKMVKGCWRSCIEPGDGTAPEVSDKNADDWTNPNPASDADASSRPFIADAIIANPPSFAHIHCAERLGIPLHMMFTMPWSPTQAFPHPLANIQSSNADANMTNFISYALVDMMTWQGLGDVINRFREKSLGLEPVSLTSAPGMLARLRVPYTYCWSPALIPKPRDWAHYISISGFYFLDLSTNFTPEPDLKAFLDAGPPPVYIGFGSIVVDDPNAMTKLIFEAVEKTGQRALVSKGWGGFGADQIGIPDNVFMLGNVPHDWLFKHVSCVVHHGGAGTTAAGIAAGRSTVVVPFFGDQPFWGAMIARAGAGPKPIAYKDLNADLLAENIKQALEPQTLERAKELSERINQEKGCDSGAKSFHEELGVQKLRCQLSPTRGAVWRIRRTEIRLSAFAAAVLISEKLLDPKDLKLYRPREYHTDDGPFDPISGGASALVGTLGSMAMGIADLPVATLKAMKIHPDAPKKSKSKASSEKERSDTTGSSSPAPSATSTLKESDDGKDSQESGHKKTQSETSHSSDDEGEEVAMAQEIGSQMARENAEKEAKSRGSVEQPVDPAKEPAKDQKPYQFDQLDFQSALETGKGAFRFASAGIKSPMDFTLGLAKGFHNAPKLYGDDTVRQPEKITDFSSGLRAAGKEFGYGFYDGITGLVTQPMDGLKKEGGAGFLKGIGRGIGGVVFKPGAAIWGIPGYTSKGMYRELQKRFGPSVDGYIIASRTAQGYAALLASTPQERAAVAADWKEVRRFVHKKKNIGEEKMAEISTRIRALSAAAEKPAQPPPDGDSKNTAPTLNRTTTSATTASSGVWSPAESSHTNMNPLSRATTATPHDDDDADLEEAIRRSVAETSKGDPAQDAMVERAIRASIAELDAARAGRAAPDDAAAAAGASHDADLHRALDESRKAHGETEQADEAARREEEVVMRYVMRQSAAEEELRQKREGGGPA